MFCYALQIHTYLNHLVSTVSVKHKCDILFYAAYDNPLKMLCLYFYTLTLGHNYGNKFSILNKLTLQKELQTFMTNNVF